MSWGLTKAGSHALRPLRPSPGWKVEALLLRRFPISREVGCTETGPLLPLHPSRVQQKPGLQGAWLMAPRAPACFADSAVAEVVAVAAVWRIWYSNPLTTPVLGGLVRA